MNPVLPHRNVPVLRNDGQDRTSGPFSLSSTMIHRLVDAAASRRANNLQGPDHVAFPAAASGPSNSQNLQLRPVVPRGSTQEVHPQHLDRPNEQRPTARYVISFVDTPDPVENHVRRGIQQDCRVCIESIGTDRQLRKHKRRIHRVYR